MKRKASKHVVLKQLRRARELFVEERCAEHKQRLELARERQVEYRGYSRRGSTAQRLLDLELKTQLWDAEVAAATLRVVVSADLAGEYFDRVMAMVADPEFQEI